MASMLVSLIRQFLLFQTVVRDMHDFISIVVMKLELIQLLNIHRTGFPVAISLPLCQQLTYSFFATRRFAYRVDLIVNGTKSKQPWRFHLDRGCAAAVDMTVLPPGPSRWRTLRHLY